MKKGLRQTQRCQKRPKPICPALRPDEEGIKTPRRIQVSPRRCPALRPDEEGIKTYALTTSLALALGPALRPDEEGIKTAAARTEQRVWSPALRPDEEGIKTASSREMKYSTGPALRPDEEGIKTTGGQRPFLYKRSGLET